MNAIKIRIANLLPTKTVYALKYIIESARKNKKYSSVEKELNRAYEKEFGKKIDWNNPRTYNEKLQVVKLYGSTKIKTELTDKLLVEKWVKKILKEEKCSFIPIIATYDSIDSVDWEILPTKYVIKMNNDSGSVIVCNDDHPISKKDIFKYKYYFQKRNFAYHGYEMQYRDIKPTIIIEEYMGDEIRDYKFACFNGKAVSCRVDFDRFKNHTRNFYDKNWNLLPYNKGDYNNNDKDIKKPANYAKMWAIAEKLSAGFDQVRVDLYEIDNKIYFGEMTFTNGSGFEKFHPSSVDYEYGRLWKLDMGKIRKYRKHLIETKAKLRD